MKKRSAAKSKSSLLTSPIPFATPNLSCESPKTFDFNLKGFNNTSSSSKKKTVTAKPITRSPFTTISDLKDLVSNHSDSLNRQLDLSHSEILKEFEASQSRLSKRFKIHTQTCQQVMDEADKENKKLSDRISENVEAMKSSYAEFMAEAQASATRVCKTSIPELTQSMEKAIDGIRSRYGVPLTST